MKVDWRSKSGEQVLFYLAAIKAYGETRSCPERQTALAATNSGGGR